MKLHNQSYETINGSDIIAFLIYLLGAMPRGTLHVILDQARYHTLQGEAKGWLLMNPRVQLHYLPPYRPNVNAFEPY